ncbi:MAG: hypothetical protein JRI50_10015 [Deltaproteobacteria bacterium]|nr:hypothetical protein [Deltaproteobacteria bacterium]MBW2135642.1 hypothetical protein [Deltaproteobacteria bacterium]
MARQRKKDRNKTANVDNRGKLVREIKKIYRRHGYRRHGCPLEKFAKPELEAHLAMLRAGRYPWITGGNIENRRHN